MATSWQHFSEFRCHELSTGKFERCGSRQQRGSVFSRQRIAVVRVSKCPGAPRELHGLAVPWPHFVCARSGKVSASKGSAAMEPKCKGTPSVGPVPKHWCGATKQPQRFVVPSLVAWLPPIARIDLERGSACGQSGRQRRILKSRLRSLGGNDPVPPPVSWCTRAFLVAKTT